MFMMSPWVQRLLIANVIVFVVTGTSPGLANDLAYYPPIALFRPWTIVSYMFLHADFGHLFFNMLGILIFGPRLETKMGAKQVSLHSMTETSRDKSSSNNQITKHSSMC